MSDYFTDPAAPVAQTRGLSSTIRGIYTSIATAFTKIAAYTGNGGKLVRINSGATAQEAMALGTANQVLGMNAGATAYEHKTLTGTANQVTVTQGVGTVTFSTPQDLHTGASPTFNSMTLTTALAVANGGTGSTTASGARTSLGLAIGTDVQAYDADLAAVAALASNGIVARTGAGTVAARTITAPAAGITISDGDGVAGNPTIALANDLAALEGLAATGLIARTSDGAASARTITAPAAGITVSNGDGVLGNPTIALANDLAALEGLAATGMIARTGDGTAAARTITAGTGCTVTNGDGVAGNPTITLTPGIGLGDIVGPGVSVDGEIILFNSTTGQLAKRATTTGLLKASSGVIGAVVSGTDIKTINGVSVLGAGNIVIAEQNSATRMHYEVERGIRSTRRYNAGM